MGGAAGAFSLLAHAILTMYHGRLFRHQLQMKTEVFRNRIERLLIPSPTETTSSRSRSGAARNWRPRPPGPDDSDVPRTRIACLSHRSKPHGPDKRSCTVQADLLPGRQLPGAACCSPSRKNTARIRTVRRLPRSRYPCNTTIRCENLCARNDLAETDTGNRAKPRDTSKPLPSNGRIQSKSATTRK